MSTQTSKSTSGWISKAEAATRLKVSEKTIERMAARDEIAQATRGNGVVFDPEDVARLALAKGLSDTVGQDAAAVALMRIPQLARIAAAAPEEDDAHLPLGELAHKVYLTTAEAVRYSGLTPEYLFALIAQKKLTRIEAMRPYRYRRSELEAL